MVKTADSFDPILVTVAAPTREGELVGRYRKPVLTMQSSVVATAYCINIDGLLTLDCLSDGTLAAVDLLLPSTRWLGERLIDVAPNIANRHRILIAQKTLAQRGFGHRVVAHAANAKSRVRVSWSEAEPDQVVALSDNSVARLRGSELLGFEVWNFR